MTVIDYILNGLEAELALERELGVREIEIDRSLLKGPEAPLENARGSAPALQNGSEACVPKRRSEASVRSQAVGAADTAGAAGTRLCFLHDRPLDAAGNDMMAKIVAALHETAATAPVVSSGTMPRAKVYVVLGALALRKWFPGRNAEPGASFTTDDGADVAVTYSPNYILRFKTVTPAVQNIKKSMWSAIKTAAKKIGG